MKKIQKSMKLILLLVIMLFSFAAFAADYSTWTLERLQQKSRELKNSYDSYNATADRYYAIAQTFRYKDGIVALNNYNRYMVMSIQHNNLAADAAAERSKVEEEIRRRNSMVPQRLSIDMVGEIYAGDAAGLSCIVYYSNGTSKIVSPSWSVSNTQCGYISGYAFYSYESAGGKSVVVTAYYGGKSVSQTLRIKTKATLQSLSISAAGSLKVGSAVALTCKAQYSNGTTKTVTPTWSVSNTKYASVSGGKITAKSAGGGKSVTVTASYGGKKVSKKFTIAKPVTLKSITVTASTGKLKIGSAVTLTCKAKYSNGTTKTVTPTWSVSNAKYASVSGGKITAKSAGGGKSVTVTASYGGKKVSKKFTIAKPVTLKSISLSFSANKITAGCDARITCKAKYSNGTTKVVSPTLSVSNTKYAYVVDNRIIAKSAGKGKSVTVTASYGGKKTTKKLSIAKK